MEMAGTEPLDEVDVGLLHLPQELPGVRRQRLHVAPLALGVDRVEGERGLPGAGQPREHDQSVTGEVERDVLEVVLTGAVDDEAIGTHGPSVVAPPTRPLGLRPSGGSRRYVAGRYPPARGSPTSARRPRTARSRRSSDGSSSRGSGGSPTPATRASSPDGRLDRVPRRGPGRARGPRRGPRLPGRGRTAARSASLDAGAHDDDQPRWSPDGSVAHASAPTGRPRTPRALGRCDAPRFGEARPLPERARRRRGARLVARTGRAILARRRRRGGRTLRRRRLRHGRRPGRGAALAARGRDVGRGRRHPASPLRDRRSVGRHGHASVSPPEPQRVGGGVVRPRSGRGDRLRRRRRGRLVRRTPVARSTSPPATRRSCCGPTCSSGG